MFRNRLIPFRAIEVGAEAERVQARVEHPVGLAQHRIAGDGIQAVMDGAVDAIVSWKIVLGMRRLHFRLQRALMDDIAIGHPGDSEFPRQPLQGRHDLETVAYIVRRQGHDLRAAIGKLNQ